MVEMKKNPTFRDLRDMLKADLSLKNEVNTMSKEIFGKNYTNTSYFQLKRLIEDCLKDRNNPSPYTEHNVDPRDVLEEFNGEIESTDNDLGEVVLVKKPWYHFLMFWKWI